LWVATPHGFKQVQDIVDDSGMADWESEICAQDNDAIEYNDVQCGWGPRDKKDDEDPDECPGKLKEGGSNNKKCDETGPLWHPFSVWNTIPSCKCDTPPCKTTTSTGDPHCTNLEGKSFDIYSTGQFTFIRYPMRAREWAASLLMRVDIKRLGPSCSQIYITNVNLTGFWLEKDVNFRAKIKSPTEPKSGGDALHRRGKDSGIEVLKDGQWTLVNFTQTPQFENFPAMSIDRTRRLPQLMLHIQGVEVGVWARERHKSGVTMNFLNIELKHFKDLPHKVGGILGLDEYVPEPGTECKTPDVALSKQPAPEKPMFLSTVLAT